MAVRGCVNRRGSMWTLFFGVERGAQRRRRPALRHRAPSRRFFSAMLERGVYLPPSQFEAAFISLAHSEGDIELTVRAAEQALAELG